jgi:hypothetical protein
MQYFVNKKITFEDGVLNGVPAGEARARTADVGFAGVFFSTGVTAFFNGLFLGEGVCTFSATGVSTFLIGDTSFAKAGVALRGVGVPTLTMGVLVRIGVAVLLGDFFADTAFLGEGVFLAGVAFLAEAGSSLIGVS